MGDNPPILPGFTMTSGVYNVMFMTANQFGSLPFKNYRMTRDLMDLILMLADFMGGNFENIKRELESELRAGEFDGSDGMATEQTTINIFDEPFFPRPKGHMRRMKISFFDQNNTTFEFSLAKKNTINTLKDLALDAVTSNVTNNLMIDKMEIPETLKMTLRKEFYNEWSRKRFPSYNITLLPFAEYLEAGGIDPRTLDWIMDEYMYRIDLTLQQLATGFLDLNFMKEIVWEPFFEEIARLGPVSLVPMFYLNLTLQELFRSLELATIMLLLSKLWSKINHWISQSLVPPRF